MDSSQKSLLNRFIKVVWYLFLFSLPVTSFPYIPLNIGGSTLVRPLAIYPLVFLLVLAVIPRLLTKRLPRIFIPLFVFSIFALISTGIAQIGGAPDLLGISIGSRAIRTIFTLGLGGLIYLTVSLLPNNEDDLRDSLKWLYFGLIMALIIGSLQAIYVIDFSPEWFRTMKKVQKFISIRKLLPLRVSGMTYEPNWFADQIVLLYLPWLLTSILNGYSAFKWRWKRFTIEWAIFAWMLFILVFTFSRAGLVIMVGAIIFGLIFLGFRRTQDVTDKPKKSNLLPRILVAVLIILVFVAAIVTFGMDNQLFARIWGYWQLENKSIADYFEYLGFGARFLYWETAFRIFEDHPMMGIGLGSYAFYFKEYMPDFQLATMPEILKVLTPEEGRSLLITSKNLYVRLLAETGLIGFGLFVSFVIGLFGLVVRLRGKNSAAAQYWGTAGLIGLVVFLVDAFSYDSFAVPNMWVVFGLITAAVRVFSPEINQE